MARFCLDFDDHDGEGGSVHLAEATILAELGRIWDDATLHDAAAMICTHQPSTRQAAAFIRRVPGVEPPRDELAAPFHGHGPRFIRAALHLWHRAQAAGGLVPLSGHCVGRQYGLSHPNR